jgi:hypothetical protein
MNQSSLECIPDFNYILKKEKIEGIRSLSHRGCDLIYCEIKEKYCNIKQMDVESVFSYCKICSQRTVTTSIGTVTPIIIANKFYIFKIEITYLTELPCKILS